MKEIIDFLLSCKVQMQYLSSIFKRYVFIAKLANSDAYMYFSHSATPQGPQHCLDDQDFSLIQDSGSSFQLFLNDI